MLPMLLPVVRAIRRANRPNPVMFSADLKTSIVPEKAVVLTPTFTRATTATVIDHEGLIQTAKSGEARFHGARREENLVTNSDTFNNAFWTKSNAGTGVLPVITDAFASAPDGSTTASRIQLSRSDSTGTSRLINASNSGVAGKVRNLSIYLKSNTGSNQSIVISTTAADNLVITVTPQWALYSTGPIAFNSLLVWYWGLKSGVDTSALSADILAWHPMWHDVAGKINQNPSEYISSGVLSAPYHGAGADGVKYFDYENGNTVSSNIVTEAKGAPITDSLLRGYLAEEQRINLVLQSQNHATTWTAVGTPTIVSGNKKYNTLILDLIGDDNVDAVEGYKQNIAFTANAAKSVSVFLKQGTSTKSTIRLRDTTAGADRLNVEITWSGSSPVATYITGSEEFPMDPLADGVYRLRFLTASVTAANTNSLEIYPATDNLLAILNTGNINIGGWQVENALTASSYIPTTTATVTRNVDNLSFPASNINNAKGSLYAEIMTNWSGSPSAASAIIGNGSTHALYIDVDQTPAGIKLHDQTSELSKTGLNDASTAIKKRMIAWGVGKSATGDGVSAGTAGFDGNLDISSLQIGCGGSGKHFNGTIREVQIYRKELSSAKLQSMTA